MKYFLPLLIYLNIGLYTQVFDDFSGRSMKNWIGDTSLFIIDNEMLVSNGSSLVPQKLAIVTANGLMDEAEWLIKINLKFNPTSANFVRIYLATDNFDLGMPLNGYFIQFGETNADTLDFFMQKDLSLKKIFTGKTAFQGNISCFLKVQRTKDGAWTFYLGSSPSQLQYEGTVTDITHENTSYFGLYCQYATTSRYNQFLFDDIQIAKTIRDTSPPHITNAFILNDTLMELTLDEAFNDIAVEMDSVLLLVERGGSPEKILVQNPKGFNKGKLNIVSVKRLEDVSHNGILSPLVLEVPYARSPIEGELVFSELMVDESPSKGLPEHEYLEIYNKSRDYIRLDNCYISDATKKYLFPEAMIHPKEYLMLCTQTASADFDDVHNKVIMTVPALTNSGKELQIMKDGVVITSLHYDDTWYHDPDKAEGGWSLELIDLEEPCHGSKNWAVSMAPQGGTPGRENSINGKIVDFVAPQLVDIKIENANQINLLFSEEVFLKDPSIQSVEMGHLGLVVVLESPLMVKLILAEAIDSTLPIALKIKGFEDCVGNKMNDIDTVIYLTKKLKQGDLLFNEIMYRPQNGHKEYIEIYNNTDTPLDVLGLSVMRTNELKVFGPVSKSKIVMPRSYHVFSNDILDVQNLFQGVSLEKMSQTDTWRSLPDDSAKMILISSDSIIIDVVQYEKGMHNPLIKSDLGVSLEKIWPKSNSLISNYWASASDLVKNGTPTLENSQTQNIEGLESTVSPKVISPDNDGHDDYCLIQFEKQSNIDAVSIKVVDMYGRVVKNIGSNLSLGYQNQFLWDGTNDLNAKAPIGQYFVCIQYFGVKTSSKMDRIPVAVFH